MSVVLIQQSAASIVCLEASKHVAEFVIIIAIAQSQIMGRRRVALWDCLLASGDAIRVS